MPKRIVTREIADIIFKSFEAMVIIPRKLKLNRYESKEALEIIRSDIREEFDVTITVETIKGYCYNTFDEFVKKRRNYKEKRRIKKGGVANPDYLEFLESVERFESGERIEINPENRYVKALSALNKYDFSVTGNRLAKDIGVNSVKEELRFLTKRGLIEHPTLIKIIMSRKGVEYLKRGGVLD